MNFNILAEEGVTTQSNWMLWILIGFMVLFLVYSVISGNSRRKKMAEEQEKRNDIHPGYKVTTIGGIIGVVEEVDNETNTFVLKTGTEDAPCFIKFDKQAIYLSENPFKKAEEEKAEEQTVTEETPVEEEKEETAEQ